LARAEWARFTERATRASREWSPSNLTGTISANASAREAQAIATLIHPHICTLHDVGPDYLVMEFVDGVPIARRLPIAERRSATCSSPQAPWTTMVSAF
jgi:serine/threonine protein kinase